MTADAKLTEWDVIEAMRSDRGVAGMSPVDVLGDRYPVKVVVSRLDRMAQAGFLEYGVSIMFPWLTPEDTWRRRPTGEPIEVE